MAAPLRACVEHLLKTVRLAWAQKARIAVAAIFPFIASHWVVMQARSIGMPERLMLDLLHGFIVLGYLAALVRVARGEASGLARFGLLWPRGIRLPSLRGLATMAVVVVVIGLPLALVLHPIVQALEVWQSSHDLYLPVTMLPEFVMTTLVGLVIAAQSRKVGA